MKFKIVDSLNNFEKLGDDWRRLHLESDQRCNVFAGFEWHRAYLHHYLHKSKKDQNQLAIVVGIDGCDLKFICPLISRSGLGATVLRFIGDPVSQYGDVIGHPDCVGPDVVHHALRFAVRTVGADAVVLRNVKESGLLAAAISGRESHVLRSRTAPMLGLAEFATADECFSKLQTATRRKQHRRLWRRLNEVGPVEFKVLGCGEEAVRRTKQALQLKMRMLAEQGIASRAFADERFAKFFEAMACGAGAEMGFQISILTCSDELVAAEIGFRTHENYVSHVGVYHSKWRRFAPGRLQIERTIRSCFENGVRKYDFLPPNAEYKRVWSTEESRVVDYGLAYSAIGHAYRKSAAAGAFITETAKQYAPAPLLQFLVGPRSRKLID